MAVDMFLKIDGIPGESTDEKHKDWIEVYSFSFGATQMGTQGVIGGGARAGRTTFSDISFQARVSKASPKLVLATASGEHLKTAQFAFTMNVGGQSVEYMTVKLTDALVSSYKELEDRTDRLFVPAVQTPPQASASFTLLELPPAQPVTMVKYADDFPLDSVSLNFAKIEISYTQFDASGKPIGIVKAGWDTTFHKAF